MYMYLSYIDVEKDAFVCFFVFFFKNRFSKCLNMDYFVFKKVYSLTIS